MVFVSSKFFYIFFFNLPSPFNKALLWLLLTPTIIILYRPKVVFSRSLIFPLIFSVIIILSNVTENQAYQLSRFSYHIAASIIILEYIMVYDREAITFYAKYFLSFILITMITSIVGLTLYPEAERFNIAISGYSYETSVQMLFFFNRIGIGDYGFIYSITFLFPVIFNYLRERKYFYSLIHIISIIRFNQGTAFIQSLIAIFISFNMRAVYRRKSIFFVLIILIFIIPVTFVSDVFLEIANVLPEGSTVQNRVNDFALTLGGDEDTHGSHRLDRIPFLVDQISDNLLYGGGRSTGHVFWLDMLSVLGLFRYLSLLFMIFYPILKLLKLFSKDTRIYFLFSIFLMIVNWSIKNGGHTDVAVGMFLVSPLLCFSTDDKTKRIPLTIIDRKVVDNKVI